MLSFTNNPVTRIADLTFDQYVAEPGINQSALKLYDFDLGGAPAKYRWRTLHPEFEPAPSDAMEFGTAYHHFVHCPDSFEQFFAVRTRELEAELLAIAQLGQKGKKSEKFSSSLTVYKEWVAQQADEGRQVITEKQADTLRAMRDALLDCEEVREEGVFVDAALEVSMFAPWYAQKDTNASLQLKARVDILPKGDALIDLKTCRSAHPREFAGQVARLGYDLQAAFYLDVARANGFDKKRFGFLAQDSQPPYLAAIHWLPEEWIKYGRLRYRKILLDIAESIRTNHWPGYQSGELMPPAWLQPEIEAIAA